MTPARESVYANRDTRTPSAMSRAARDTMAAAAQRAVDIVKEVNRVLNWTARAAPALRDGTAHGVISPAHLVTMASGARRCVLTAGKGTLVMP